MRGSIIIKSTLFLEENKQTKAERNEWVTSVGSNDVILHEYMLAASSWNLAGMYTHLAATETSPVGRWRLDCLSRALGLDY